jgi:hypothetical protein
MNSLDLTLILSLTSIQQLRDYMDYLHKTLSYPTFRRIWRVVFDTLQDLLWNELLVKQDFTTLGAARLMQDILAIKSIVDLSTSSFGPGTALGMPKLREGVQLLNLPLEAQTPNDVSLAEAAKGIYSSNSEASAILERLGFSHLSRADARIVLGRRVEASE